MDDLIAEFAALPKATQAETLAMVEARIAALTDGKTKRIGGFEFTYRRGLAAPLLRQMKKIGGKRR